MQHSAFSVPLSLILLGLGSAACGQAADGGHADATPSGGGSADEGPELGSDHRRGPTHLDPSPSAAAGQGGDSGAASPPDTSAAASAATPARTATPRPDTTAPRVVSVQPANGAIGVSADARIVIEFSEPMAQHATGDAFASETLPRAHTIMTWNEAGTVLTLAPESPLTYAHATLEDSEPLELRAATYGYTLTRFATDLAGNPLAETSVQFSTLREVTHTLTPVAELTGALRAEPFGGEQQTRVFGFVTFDAEVIPAGVVKLERVVAELGAHSVNQPVPVYDVRFEQLSAAPTGAAPGAQIGVFASGTAGALPLPEPVCALLINAYLKRTNAHHYSQFRLDLPAATAAPAGPSLELELELVNRALGQTSLVADYLLP